MFFSVTKITKNYFVQLQKLTRNERWCIKNIDALSPSSGHILTLHHSAHGFKISAKLDKNAFYVKTM